MFGSTTTTSEYSILECQPIVRPLVLDKTTTKWRYNNIEIAPNCPRCASSNTKFCYYNNYSLSQPRYFCKACRRYWTKGGSLRNVPVGGGCRKSRRSRAAARHSGGGAAFSAAVSPAAVGSADISDGSACTIDMAAVFAKYVNCGSNEDDSLSPGDSNGSSDENAPASSINGSQVEDVNGITFDQLQGSMWDSINGVDDQVQQALPQFCVQQEIDGQDFVFQDCCGGLDQLQQGVLGDGVSDADMMWSDGSDFPSFGSQYDQQMVQVQDFGLFSPDDQFRISAGNLATDNLGSFDLSACEVFSTP